MAMRATLSHKAPEPTSIGNAPVPSVGETPTTSKAGRASTREGKRSAMVWLEPASVKQLGRMALDGDTTVQALLVEAVNDLFAKHGLSRFD